MSVTSVLMISNYYWGDEQNYVSNWVSILTTVLVIELKQYITVRAQVQLFVRLATIQQQEQQLSDLLDMVPDNVFICSKSQENRAH